MTYASKNRFNETRYGITTSKKIGKAVKRNRAKRVIRCAFEQLEPRLNGNYDFVFVARSKTPQVKMQEVLAEMENHFILLGVID